MYELYECSTIWEWWRGHYYHRQHVDMSIVYNCRPIGVSILCPSKH